MILQKGAAAPDFELHATPDQKLKLSDLRGKRVILAFYPADWSPVCGDQMALYNEMLRYFHKYNAEIIGISVDSKWCHMAFEQDRHLHFPCWLILNPKALCQGNTACTTIRRDKAGEGCLCSTRKELFNGVIFLPMG